MRNSFKVTVSGNSIKRTLMCEEIEVASAHTHTHTHTHTHLHTCMQNVLHVGTLINEVSGSLGPAAGLGK